LARGSLGAVPCPIVAKMPSGAPATGVWLQRNNARVLSIGCILRRSQGRVSNLRGTPALDLIGFAHSAYRPVVALPQPVRRFPWLR